MGEDDAAAGNVEAVHEDEAAGGGDLINGVEGDGLAGAEHQLGGLMAMDGGLAGALDGLQRGGVDDALDLLDLAVGFLRGELEAVVASRDQGLLAEPEDAGFETGQPVRRGVLEGGDGPALDKDLLGEGDADAFAGLGGVARRRGGRRL